MSANLSNDDQRYQAELTKMQSNEHHSRHHYDPKIMKKAIQAKRDLNYAPPDKYEILKDENLQLQRHQNTLSEQVKVIQAKLQRQIQHLSKNKLIVNQTTVQFEYDLDKLIEEDIKLQEEERILMLKVKKLQAKRQSELQQGKNLYSVAEEHRTVQTTKAEADQMHVINTMKAQVEKQNQHIVQLKRKLFQQQQEQAEPSYNNDELIAEKRRAETRLMQARSKVEDMQCDIRVKSEVFQETQAYSKQLFATLKQKQDEFQQLESQRRQMESATRENQELRAKLSQVQNDRDRLQNDFDALMRQPFFKKESNEKNLQNVSNLQKTLDSKENEILKLTTLIQKQETDTQQAQNQIKSVQQERDRLQDDLKKMRQNLEPGSLTIDDIMQRLKAADPSKFRDCMDDLAIQGTDPNWFKMQLGDTINMYSQQESLKPLRDRLIQEKAQLATELTRIQNLLKLQCDIDKSNTALMQAELTQMHQLIKNNAQKVKDVNQMIQIKTNKLIQLQQAAGVQGITKQDLDKFNTTISQLKKEAGDDQLSEFSIITDESEIQARENRLDLRISTAAFDKVSLMQIMGGREIQPSELRTFVSIDFYNHDSKHTDHAEGFEPIYNTLFSFKNTVDDFYLQHLEKAFMTVDIFGVPPQTIDNKRANGAIRIGTAKLPLVKLIEGDFSFQAQEIIHETERGGLKVGKVFFRMRMRKPLDQALKWYNQAKQLASQQQEKAVKQMIEGSAGNKFIQIQVNQATNLQIFGQPGNPINMLPFFSYDFYTFEVRSHTSQTNSPMFESRKQFQVEATPQFLNFMKTQTLVIDLIDESIDVTNQSQKDYIGSVRIPLRDVVIKGIVSGTFQVINENRQKCGELQVSIAMFDASATVDVDEKDKLTQTHWVQREALRIIGTLFAQFDLEMVCDMLMTKDTTQQGKVTKQQLKQFLVNDLKINMLDRDIEVFIKTLPAFTDKDLLTRPDIMLAFEKCYNEAKERSFLEQAGKPLSRSQQQEIFGSKEPARKPIVNPFESSQKAQSVPQTDLVGLEKKIKEQLYQVLNKFQDECGIDFPGATLKQTTNVLQTLGATQQESLEFFNRHQIKDLLFYKDCLYAHYGTQHQPTKVQRSKAFRNTVTRIKQRVLEYMIQQNFNVDELFAVLQSQKTDITEQAFADSLGTKVQQLTRKDLSDMFAAIDVDKSGTVSLVEIQREFADISVAMILKEMKGIDIKKLFSAVDVNENGKLDVVEFAELINLGCKSASQEEVNLLFNVLDKQNLGFLTLQDITQVDYSKVLEVQIQTQPNDLFMPLMHKLKHRLNLRADAIYEKYQNNNKVSLVSLQQIIQQFLGFTMDEDEVDMMESVINQMFGKSYLDLKDIQKLFVLEFKHKSLGKGNQKDAEATAKKLQNVNIQKYQTMNESANKEINVRSFKMCLKAVAGLQTVEIDNLVQYLDQQNTGFVGLAEINKLL